MQSRSFPLPILALTLSFLAVQALPQARADVITHWNAVAIDATKTGLDGKSGPKLNSNLASRIHAIEAIAVYDAVNSVRKFGKPYLYYAAPSSTASAESAAAQAAHDVLAKLVPGTGNAQVALLDKELAASLKAIGAADAELQAGVAVGKAAAAAILAARQSDGSTPNRTFAGPANPGFGEWRPTPVPQTDGTLQFPPGINQQWGDITPFVLDRVARFQPVTPPRVGSRVYKKALEEVKQIGSATSTTRTADQTHIAQFWKQDAELPPNEAARLLAESKGTSLEKNARLFAALDIALADARIATWSAKYRINYWRPVTALNANPDGTVTNNYSAWTPLLVTPSHPSYSSGHSATVGAGIEVLKAYFGDRNTVTLHTTTAGLNPPTRTLTKLSKGAVENDLSRIYGGIHYRFDDVAGHNLGVKVGKYVLKRFPRGK